MHISMEYFLRLLGTQSPRQQPKSFETKQRLISKQQQDNLSIQLKKIFNHFFNSKKNKIEMQSVMPFTQRKTTVPLCNKLFHQAQTVYKCYDCFIHQASVLCVQCFENGHHVGHRFKKFSSGGGNCDCGNPLALKKQGFCVNHTGKIEIPEINEGQQQKFNQIFFQMFKWLFKLLQLRDSLGQIYYGQILFQYLTKLNTESIYYNILTFRLLTKNSQKGPSFLAEFLKIKAGKLPSVIIQLFFSMFALDEFKLILANEYLKAYNTLPGFQKSSFHSLYIQLFANDNIVIQVTNRFKNTIQVTKLGYDVQKYISDLSFISSISIQPAITFYQMYFKRNKYVPYPFLDQIQQKLQLNSQLHEVDLVTKYISIQNNFYYLFIQMYQKIKNYENLIILVVKGLLQVLNGKYSYNKNKAILPYHRVLAIGIFALFKGQIQQISIKALSVKLNLQQQYISKILFYSAIQVINCLFDFAATYVCRNYFDNYITLYMRNGNICGLYDQLFLKILACVFLNQNKDFTKILNHKLQRDIASLKQTKTYQQDLLQMIKKYIRFCQILVQIGVTHSAEIIANQKLSLQNNKIQQKKKQLFSQILTKTGPITREDIKLIQKVFINPVDDQFLFQNTQFNKSTKKYSAKQSQLVKQVPDFYYEIYISKRKSGITFLIQQDEKSVIQKLSKAKAQQKNNNQEKLLNILIPRQFISNLLNFLYQKSSKISQKQMKNISLSFLCLISKISYFFEQKQNFKEINKKFAQISPIEQIFGHQQDNLAQNLRLLNLKKKSESKKNKFLQKQKKVLQKLSLPKQNQEQVSDSLICILCRDNKTKIEDLCYFSNLRYKRLMSNVQSENDLGFIYDTCFHTVHYSCFMETYKNNIKFNCPLCKAQSNILLAVNVQYTNHAFVKSMDRTIQIGADIQARYSQQKIQKNDLIFLGFTSMVGHLVQFIGFVGVLTKIQDDKKTWRLCCHLIKLLILQWNNFTGQQKQNIYKIYAKQLKKINIQQKINEKYNNVQAIKHCILFHILNFVQGKQIDLNNTIKIYDKKINDEDLKIIRKNIGLVLSLNSIQSSNQMVQETNIKRLQTQFKFYSPPETVKQLIKLRDQITSKNCKNGHNVSFCCLCSQIVCSDCKTLTSHNRKHGTQSMYFNLLIGGMTFYLPKRICLQSLYENKLGGTWNQSKDPQGYFLNKQSYIQLTQNFLFHQIQDHFRNKTPKLLEQNDYIDLLMNAE